MSFGIPAALLFGLVLIIASLSLFITSKLKPNLYEDSDNIYVVVGIVCGLLLLVSLDLGAAMALQQMLMVSAVITLMWRFMNLRAENKQLKARQPGAERSKATYNARLEDEDDIEVMRERRQGRRRRSTRYDDERRLLGDTQESELEPMLSRRRERFFRGEALPTFDADDRYDERRNADNYHNRRQSSPDWDDESDWNPAPTSPSKPRRVLPAAQTRTATRSTSDESLYSDQIRTATRSTADESFNGDEVSDELTPRRRRRNNTERIQSDSDSASATRRRTEGSMTGYVNYEPVDPPSGLPASGSEPIVFPDRY